MRTSGWRRTTKGAIMLVSKAAEKYVTDRQLARTPVYSAARFASVIGDMEIEEISQEHVDKFQGLAKQNGWASRTIKGTVKDIRTLTKHYCGFSPVIRVAVNQLSPTPTPVEHIDAVRREWVGCEDVLHAEHCTRINRRSFFLLTKCCKMARILINPRLELIFWGFSKFIHHLCQLWISCVESHNSCVRVPL